MPSRLIAAIEQGNVADAIEALGSGCDVEEPDVHGFAGLPLRLACFKGHYAIAVALLKHGADVASANHEGRNSPIRLAARGKQTEIIRLLLEHGADPPPGIDLGLSPEDVSKAQLVAQIAQRSAGASTPPASQDHHLTEVSVSDDELEKLFGKTVSKPTEKDVPATPEYHWEKVRK